MEVERYRSLSEIDKTLWNSIIGENSLTKSYEFLLSVEQSMNEENAYWYLLFFSGKELVAHACLFTHYVKVEDVANCLLSSHRIESIRTYYKDFLKVKVLGCGTPIATCSDVLTISKIEYLSEIIKQLSKIMLEIGKKEKARIVMIRDFTKSTDSTNGTLIQYGYKKVESLPTSFVTVKWQEFEQYLDSFRSKDKVKMRRNIRRFNKDKIRVELIEDFSPYVDDMIAVYNQVYNKAEYKFEKLNKEFLHQINKNLGQFSKAIIVSKDQKIVAIELIVEDERILRPLYVGIDYQYNDEYKLYFNMIYLIIKMGIELKKDYVELGQTCYYPKRKAGAYIESIHMYIRFRNKLVNKIGGGVLSRMFDGFVQE